MCYGDALQHPAAQSGVLLKLPQQEYRMGRLLSKEGKGLLFLRKVKGDGKFRKKCDGGVLRAQRISSSYRRPPSPVHSVPWKW